MRGCALGTVWFMFVLLVVGACVVAFAATIWRYAFPTP